MKDKRPRYRYWTPFQKPTIATYVQAPLPDFLHTLPILLTIEGQGSETAGSPPLTLPEPSPNE